MPAGYKKRAGAAELGGNVRTSLWWHFEKVLLKPYFTESVRNAGEASVLLARDLGYGDMAIDDAFEIVSDMAGQRAQALIEAHGVEGALAMLRKEYGDSSTRQSTQEADE